MALKEEIPKVFDNMSDPDSGELSQTLYNLGEKQLKPSESRYDIWEGNLCMDRQQTQTQGLCPQEILGSHPTLVP